MASLLTAMTAHAHVRHAPPDLAGQRILVTGGAGFIGSRLVTQLVADGAEVAVIDDLSAGNLGNLNQAFFLGMDPVRVWRHDIRSAEAVGRIAFWRPSVLVHLAGQVSLRQAIQMPVQDAAINVGGTVNLLVAAADTGVTRVVFAASSAVYGQVKPERLPIGEDQPFAPTTPYGLSKVTALGYLEWFRRHRDLPYVALALANVYGPGQTTTESGVVARFVTAVRLGREPVIFGDGAQTRDFVHVDDVVDAIVRACSCGGNGLINVGSGAETSVRQVLDLVAAAAGATPRPKYVDAIVGEPRRLSLAVGKAREILSWAPTIALAEGIQLVYEELAAAEAV